MLRHKMEASMAEHLYQFLFTYYIVLLLTELLEELSDPPMRTYLRAAKLSSVACLALSYWLCTGP